MKDPSVLAWSLIGLFLSWQNGSHVVSSFLVPTANIYRGHGLTAQSNNPVQAYDPNDNLMGSTNNEMYVRPAEAAHNYPPPEQPQQQPNQPIYQQPQINQHGQQPLPQQPVNQYQPQPQPQWQKMPQQQSSDPELQYRDPQPMQGQPMPFAAQVSADPDQSMGPKQAPSNWMPKNSYSPQQTQQTQTQQYQQPMQSQQRLAQPQTAHHQPQQSQQHQQFQQVQPQQQQVQRPRADPLKFNDPGSFSNRPNAQEHIPGNTQVPQTVQGGSLRTFGRAQDAHQYGIRDETHSVIIGSDQGRPVEANVEIWQGPNYAAQTLQVYSQDGNTNPWKVEFTSPRDAGNVVQVRNTGPLEFPVSAQVHRQPMNSSSSLRATNNDNNYTSGAELRPSNMDPQRAPPGGAHFRQPSSQIQPQQPLIQPQPQYRNYQELRPHPTSSSSSSASTSSQAAVTKTIQGGDLDYFPLAKGATDMEIVLYSEGLPFEAKIELWLGPGNIQQVAEITTDNGHTKPFRVVIPVPRNGGGKICIVNTGPEPYPLNARVKPLNFVMIC